MAIVGAITLTLAMPEERAEAQVFGNQAAAVDDGFAYAGSSVPAPWQWSAVSGPYNRLLPYLPDYKTHGEILTVSYPGSGNWTLFRDDVAGANAVYSIQFWDDGSIDTGEIFRVSSPNGHWIGIGVNDNVVKGKYYLRTDADNGNVGLTIQTPRHNPNVPGNWHTFEIYVTSIGSYPMVDGVDIPYYLDPLIVTASSVALIGSWSKPKHITMIDNFKVRPLPPTTVPLGTRFLPSTGSIYSPQGIGALASLTVFDIFNLLGRGDGAAWRLANPARFQILFNLFDEQLTGLCGDAARARYDASGEWCSEFARSVLTHSQGVRNSCMNLLFGDDTCTFKTCLSEVTETAMLARHYMNFVGGFTGRADVTAATPKPGDYVALVSGSTHDHFGHSEMVFAVSYDGRYFWTIGGNIDDCVKFRMHDFFVDGVLAPDIDGFGNSDVLIENPIPKTTMLPFCR